MEQIMSYGDDSEDEEISENNKSSGAMSESSSQSKMTGQEKIINKFCVEDINSKNDTLKIPNKSKDTFNYLGLETPKETTSYFRNAQVNNEVTVSRKIQTSYGEVDVPGSDFWKDFTPDNVPVVTNIVSDNLRTLTSDIIPTITKQLCDKLGTICYNFKRGSHEICTMKTGSNILQTSNNSKNLHFYTNDGNTESDESPFKQMKLSDTSTDIYSNSSSFPKCQMKQFEHVSEDPVSFGKNTDNLGNTMTGQARKLYYVHSKVAPYINAELVSKCPGKITSSWPAHVGVVNRLAWNVPNFSHLLATAGMDTTVRVWNVWSNLDRCVASLGCHKKAVKHVEWCQNGRKILSCSFDRTAQVTDVETAKTVGQFEHMGFVTSGNIHPSNPNLFLTGTDNMILKWDMRTQQAPIRCFNYKDNFGQVEDLLFINHGQEFASCNDLISRDSADRTIMVWDMRTGTVLSNQIFQERYMCTRLKLHPNNTVFMAQTHAGYIALFSVTSPYKMDKMKRYEGHKIQGHSIGFDISTDGGLVYSGSAGDGIHCYHQQSGRMINKLSSKSDIITDVACHPVLPSVLASCTWGGSVSLWK